MKKSKLYELLSTFNKKQIQEVTKVIQTNNDENLVVLLKHLLSKSDDSLLSRAYILESLFKNKLDEKRLQKLLNDGVQHCEWVIIKSDIENDKHKQQLILAKYYQKQKLDKYFNQQVNLIKEEIKTSKENSSTYYNLYRLEYLIIEQALKSNLRTIDYSNLNNYLGIFYEIEQLKIKCVTITNLNNNLQLLPPKSVLYQQLHNCYSMLLSETEEEYIKNWDALILAAQNIDHSDLGLIINIYFNYCIKQLNKNNSIFYKHLLNAYIFSLDNTTLFEENGLLLPSHFKNIITISLRLNKLDYAYEFANKYKNYLPEETKEDVFNYNLAHIYFYQSKYDDILILLAKSKFVDVFYKLGSRVLQIKTYAELTFLNNKYDDVLDSGLNAFKKFVYTNKEIDDTYATIYKNFYKVMNKLNTSTPPEISNYIDEIKLLKPLPEIEWLISYSTRKSNNKR